MATVAAVERKQGGVQTISYTTLDGSTDQFPYKPNTEQLLIIKNDSGGTLTPILVGSATSFDPAGYEPPIDVSTGYNLGAIADGSDVRLFVSSVREVLGSTAGNVAINAGTGLEVALLEG